MTYSREGKAVSGVLKRRKENKGRRKEKKYDKFKIAKR